MEEREKAALMGPNGAGKSTLLENDHRRKKLNAGFREDLPSSPAGKSLGYLAQHQELSADATIYEEVLKSQSNIFWIWKQKIRTMEAEMKHLTGPATARSAGILFPSHPHI